MVIWKDIYMPIKDKIWHIHKLNKKVHKDITSTFGDIPVLRFNEITKKFEKVINPRGRAYAARRRLKYRKPKDDGTTPYN